MISSKPQKTLFVIFGGILILALLCFTLYEKGPQPVFEGKTARYWVDQYKRSKSSAVFDQADAEFLIAAFNQTQTLFDAFVRSWGPKLNPKLPIQWQMDVSLRQRNIPQLRTLIVRSLYRKKPHPRKALFVYLTAFRDSDETLKSAAIGGLGSLGPDAISAVPILIDSLNIKSPYLRRGIIQALAEISVTDERTVSALMKHLQDSEMETRLTAAQALVQVPEMNRAFGQNEATIQALTSIIQGPRSDFVWAALECAERVRPISHDFSFVLMEAAKDEDNRVRGRAIAALGNMTPPSPAALAAVELALQDTDSNVRETVAEALQKMKTIGSSTP